MLKLNQARRLSFKGRRESDSESNRRIHFRRLTRQPNASGLRSLLWMAVVLVVVVWLMHALRSIGR